MERLPENVLRAVIGEDVEPSKKKKNDPAQHWTPAVLLERAAYLRKLARAGNGSASETIGEYPSHKAMLSFRARSGEAEIHEEWADLFVVLAGAATMVVGGTVVGARNVGPGEARGDAIEGGLHQSLRVGDVMHVPAGAPHQFLLAGDKTVTSLVMKIKEAAFGKPRT
jgi:mannose-6-phosphate isomerase-like protein (cupin superfamily)